LGNAPITELLGQNSLNSGSGPIGQYSRRNASESVIPCNGFNSRQAVSFLSLTNMPSFGESKVITRGEGEHFCQVLRTAAYRRQRAATAEVPKNNPRIEGSSGFGRRVQLQFSKNKTTIPVDDTEFVKSFTSLWSGRALDLLESRARFGMNRHQVINGLWEWWSFAKSWAFAVRKMS